MNTRKKSKIFITLITFLIILSIIATTSIPAFGESDDSIIFPDSNLKEALILAGVDTDNDGEISKAEASAYSYTLDLSRQGISNLEGLEYFTNLTGLDISNNEITDLSPLKNLTKLASLPIHNNCLNLNNALRHVDANQVALYNKINAVVLANDQVGIGGIYGKEEQRIDYDKSKITSSTPVYKVLFVIVTDIDATVPLANGSKARCDYTMSQEDITLLKAAAKLFEKEVEKLSNYSVNLQITVYETKKKLTQLADPGREYGVYDYQIFGSDIPEIRSMLKNYDTSICTAYLNPKTHEPAGVGHFNADLNVQRGEAFVCYDTFSSDITNKRNFTQDLNNGCYSAFMDTYIHEFTHTLEQYGSLLGINMWEFHDCLDTDISSVNAMHRYLTGEANSKNRVGITKKIYKNSPIKYLGLKPNIKTLTVHLSAKTYTYNGHSKKPSVKFDEPGFKKDKDYKVTYSNNVKVGTATVTITGIGKYAGSITRTFKINPVKTSIKSLTKGKKKITVKWSKKSTQVTGYQIRYSTKSSMSGAKVVKIKSYKTTSKTISKLKAKKKYYVQVRTYKTVKGKTYYSSWSTKKSVKTK